jgi:hypothetical protein
MEKALNLYGLRDFLMKSLRSMKLSDLRAYQIHMRCERLSLSTILLTIVMVSLICALILGTPRTGQSLDKNEVLRYEVTWKGHKAGHGDITMTNDRGRVKVIVQAVTDGYLKAILELWSRIIAEFSEKGLKPRNYRFAMRSNILKSETVNLTFNHKKKLVTVDKQKGGERDIHAERFHKLYDPVSAFYLLRTQEDFSKPMFVDIYDGKDKARLFVNHAAKGPLKVKGGGFKALGLDLRLVKLTGDKEEVAKARLWVSDDERRIPLLLQSHPIVGEVRFELVKIDTAQK